MAWQHRPNSGTAFKNKRKTNASQPSLKGDGLGECPHCGLTWTVDLAIWTRVSRKGEKYASVSFKPALSEVPPDGAAGGMREPGDDSDIPF